MDDLQYVLRDLKNSPGDLTPAQAKWYAEYDAAHKQAIQGYNGMHRMVGLVHMQPMENDEGITLTKGTHDIDIPYDAIDDVIRDLTEMQKLLKPALGKMAAGVYRAERAVAERKAALSR